LGGLLRGAPQGRGYGSERLEESSVEGHAKELGGGVKRKRGANQRELRLMRSLVRVQAEKVAFTFCGVNWDTPFQGPFFEVVEVILDGMHSF